MPPHLISVTNGDINMGHGWSNANKLIICWSDSKLGIRDKYRNYKEVKNTK